ncbi:hypothetical protein AC578_3331 [Pseudocercospora eumusae]|uniref:Tat pathway signal sequence n=1 Tax=Pseudocercospora eumusae TaxID=321146 RepID=A0A139GVF5_9PEZI|nr:hypothetical protein AC578_3331 [Pseudocercospora eumusae]
MVETKWDLFEEDETSRLMGLEPVRPTRPHANKTIAFLHQIWSCLRFPAIICASCLAGFVFRGVVHSSSFLPDSSNGTIWQQPPSLAVDAAWQALTRNYGFLITEADMRLLGKDPTDYVKVPSSYGYGSKKYLARFSHTHNIHCLNRIRKFLHHDYYGFANITVDWIHTRHCLHALLDHFVCNVQYDIFNYVWVEGEPWPQADLQFTRQCKSLDALIDWNEANRVDLDKRVLYLQPKAGDKIFPQDPEYRELEYKMERANPQFPNREEQRAENQRKLHDALTRWKETGIIPMMDREERERMSGW